MPVTSEAAILNRIIEPGKPRLPPQLAREILRWQFAEEDRTRMHELMEKSKAGKLTSNERASAEAYERVGHLLSTLKSKARTSLKSGNGRS
jgi:hypothetical protein